MGDKLRELLLNECYEHCDLLSEDDKSEVLFQLFRIVVVGGALCQPDDSLDRYACIDAFVQWATHFMVNTFHTQVLDPNQDAVQRICHDLQVRGTIRMKRAMVLAELIFCSMLLKHGPHMDSN